MGTPQDDLKCPASYVIYCVSRPWYMFLIDAYYVGALAIKLQYFLAVCEFVERRRHVELRILS